MWRYPIGKGRGTVREHSGAIVARAGSTPARYTMYPWPSGLRRLTQVQLSQDAQVRTLQGTNFYILVIDSNFDAENISVVFCCLLSFNLFERFQFNSLVWRLIHLFIK